MLNIAWVEDLDKIVSKLLPVADDFFAGWIIFMIFFGLPFFVFFEHFLMGIFDGPDFNEEVFNVFLEVVMIDKIHEFLVSFVEGVVPENDSAFVNACVRVEIEIGFLDIGYVVEVDHVDKEAPHLGVVV